MGDTSTKPIKSSRFFARPSSNNVEFNRCFPLTQTSEESSEPVCETLHSELGIEETNEWRLDLKHEVILI